MYRWPTIRLGDVLELKIDAVPIDPAESYKIAGVYSFGRGLLAREPLLGSETTYKVFHRLHEGDFVMSQLKAWEGALARVPGAFDGWFLSPQFPTFRPVEGKLDISYFDWYCKQLKVWESLRSSARGMGARRDSVSAQTFLSMLLPLPPLEEQRRIVARIEELTAKIEEARGLRRQTANEVEALLSSCLRHLLMPTDGWQIKLISDCSTMSTGTTPPSHMKDYYEGDLQWYTPGDLKFSKTLGRSSRTVSDRAVAEGKVRVFQPGTVLFVAIGASLGKVGLAYDRCSSNQQITGVKFSSDILPEYGFWWMRRLYSDLRAAAPQATLPIINQRRIGQFEIAIPPLREQRRIVAHLDDLQTKLDALKRLQAETAAELDAMLPSILDKAFRGSL